MSGLHMVNQFNVQLSVFYQNSADLKHSEVEPDVIQILIHGVVRFISTRMILPKFEEC